MLNSRLVGRRGQAAVWVIPVLLLLAVGVWYLTKVSQENAALRAQLGDKGGSAPAAAPRPAAPAASGSASAPAGGRVLDEDHQKAFRQVLEGEAGATKKAWIQVQAGDREAAALGAQLAELFKQAGWTADVSTATGMNLKPGIFFFEAEEESPTFVTTALEALKAGGLEATNAAGYRAYYEDKKKENPRWVGIELGPNQAFALVIGPKPAS